MSNNRKHWTEKDIKLLINTSENKLHTLTSALGRSLGVIIGKRNQELKKIKIKNNEQEKIHRIYKQHNIELKKYIDKYEHQLSINKELMDKNKELMNKHKGLMDNINELKELLNNTLMKLE